MRSWMRTQFWGGEGDAGKESKMSQDAQRNSLRASIGSLGWPLIVGAASCSMLYVVILKGPFHASLLHRYVTAHPVSYAATAIFFVGVASLVFRLFNVLGQYSVLDKAKLPELHPGGQPVRDCSDLLDLVEGWSDRIKRSYLGRRLADALDYVERTGSSEGLRDELKFLGETADEEQHEGYSLARIVIWATPMLGFLGTVIGITQALGNLDSAELASSPKTAMDKLLAGLYVAFDTTTLALSLSLVSMFFKFFVERLESTLLRLVERRAVQELIGRFDAPTAFDPNVVAIRRMTEDVVQSSEELAIRQSEIWQATIDAAHQQWSALVETAGEQLEDSLADSIKSALTELRSEIAKTGDTVAKQATGQWDQWQKAFQESATLLKEQQEEMAKQGAVMTKALEATGDVIKLENALNNNLKTLAGAKHFEETVMSLSATIHLLNTRLGSLNDATATNVELQGDQPGANKDDSEDRAA